MQMTLRYGSPGTLALQHYIDIIFGQSNKNAILLNPPKCCYSHSASTRYLFSNYYALLYFPGLIEKKSFNLLKSSFIRPHLGDFIILKTKISFERQKPLSQSNLFGFNYKLRQVITLLSVFSTFICKMTNLVAFLDIF